MTIRFDTVRDPFLSVYQSAVLAIAKQIDRQSNTSARKAAPYQSAESVLSAIAADLVMREAGIPPAQGGDVSVSRDLTAAASARYCAEFGLRYLKSLVANDPAATAQLQQEFTAGPCDPAWLTTITAYKKYLDGDGRRLPIPYIAPHKLKSNVIKINAGSRIAILADWGTGTLSAMDVLSNIRTCNPDVVVHLGDIYYSGTKEECDENFANPVAKILRSGNKPVPVYALSGNHDMYSGGEGYYALISTLNPEPFRQHTSYFCLRTDDDNWQFLAMDTGLHDDSPFSIADTETYIEEEELEWLCARVSEFSGRTILLSHHQLFSAYSPIGTVRPDGSRSPINSSLAKAYERIRSHGKIAAWFWGHEHTLSLYSPFAGLERGRCVGHGAIPVSVNDPIFEPVTGLTAVPRELQYPNLKTDGRVYAHGFVTCLLGGETCRVDYHQVASGRGNVLYSEIIG